MHPITSQPRPTVPQELVSEAPEETIGKACASRAYDECSYNFMCGTGIGVICGICGIAVAPVPWQGFVVNTLTGSTVGACLSHKTTYTLFKALCKRPVLALCDRESLCPSCPRLNTASSQSDEASVRNV